MKSPKRRRIGRTGLEVTEFGMGAAPLGNLLARQFGPTSDQQARETVEAAYAGGVRYYDSAPFYGYGLSERRLGDALRVHQRDDYVLSTKAGRMLRPAAERPGADADFPHALQFEAAFDYSYDGVMRSVEDSYQRLGLHRIDIVFLHDVGDALTHGEKARQTFVEVMEGGFRALDSLRRDGVIGAVGIGVNEWEICVQAMREGDFDCFLVAGRYTLLEQGALTTVLPECERRGVSVVVGAPYNSGILATGTAGDGPYNYVAPTPEVVETVRRIEAVCAAHAVPLAAAALQFPLGHPAVAAVIPGCRSAAEVQQNLAMFETSIPAALWSDLKTEGLLDADAPVPG